MTYICPGCARTFLSARGLKIHRARSKKSIWCHPRQRYCSHTLIALMADADKAHKDRDIYYVRRDRRGMTKTLL